MTIYGTQLHEAGTQVSFSQGTLSVSATSYTNVHSVSNLDAGTYMCHFCITPSTSDGQAPNSDPDSWYMRIFRNGSVLVDEAYFQEGGSAVFKQSASQAATFTSNGTDDIYFQVRTTDGDGGGVGGRYQAMVFPIMRRE
tara:strand:+ start:98 stop:514 length:417 start_codon:yes stop_codon:yes gene_type:complete